MSDTPDTSDYAFQLRESARELIGPALADELQPIRALVNRVCFHAYERLGADELHDLGLAESLIGHLQDDLRH